ncbi:hypothetical protein DL98DRAFT_499838 [Cadophora sp. DSE1049]|nr:hypothetical protein DL98DRAFT_499838 [Cadophora sp. DSE1049]
MPVVTHLWLSGSEHLDLATEKLADASREARWRVPIGDSGMLDFYLGVLPLCGDDKKKLKLQTMRLIGNACADDSQWLDNNRAKVLFRGALPCVINLIKDPFFSSIAVVVCYNICVDFEPAQKVASEKEITHVIIHHLSEHHPIYEAGYLEHCCELLALMITQGIVLSMTPVTRMTSILKSTHDPKVQIAALSLLNSLASLPRNKAELGNAGLIEFLPTLWYAAQNVPVQNASIRLTRNLLVGTWDNVRRFYRRLSRDKDSPAHMRSNISLLLAVFHHTPNETTKIEISRLITTLCRVGIQRKPDDALKLEQNKKKFYFMHPELDKPLIFMITQQKSGIVRSEGWFTLALMASTPEGAECVSGVLSEDGGMQALVETLEGKSILNGQPTTPNWPQWIDQFMGEGWDLGGNTQTATPMEDSQTLKMARIDRKNARAILRVLVNSGLDTIDHVQLSMYEGLLVTGSP